MTQAIEAIQTQVQPTPETAAPPATEKQAALITLRELAQETGGSDVMAAAIAAALADNEPAFSSH